MITNEKQYKISRARLNRLKDVVDKFDVVAKTNVVGSKALAKAELDAIQSEIEIARQELEEYESLRAGSIQRFEAKSLSELPDLLVKARIARGLSQAELAQALGVKPQQIQRYESERYGSASLSRLKEISNVLKLNVREIGVLGDVGSQLEQTSEVIDLQDFPLREIYKRGWFDMFTGSLKEAEGHYSELIEFLLSSLQCQPSLALNRQRIRSRSRVDEMALLAWQARVLLIADKMDLGAKFRMQDLSIDFMRKIVELSTESDGPVRAKEQLRQIGIPLIFLSHLPSTHIDGAAIMKKGRPTVAMTLRYDRLDNFWFVLLHELSHIRLHLKGGQIDSILDDIDSTSAEQIEAEADELARNTLIPNSEWEIALPRFVQTRDAVKAFATQLGISPAIIAGRIRHESQNYTILTDLIGQGEVRYLFPKIESGE